LFSRVLSILRPGSRKPKLDRAQQLSARPMRLVEAEITPTDLGGAKLKVPVRPTRVARVLLRSPGSMTRSFELDSVGLFVWNLCDGKTNVSQLVHKVSRHLKITPREAEVATLTFLTMLARKGLIGLEVKDRGDGKSDRATK
jgi:hypothetical protein